MARCPAYVRLEQIFTRLSLVEQALGILHWDMAAMMPPGGAASRGEQLATLKTLAHEILTDAAVGPLLEDAGAEDLDAWQQANLAEMRRDWVHAAMVPSPLVEALSKASSACETVWRQARPASDFKMVIEPLGTLLRLTREIAEIKSQALAVFAL